jgi:hypothetical protein
MNADCSNVPNDRRLLNFQGRRAPALAGRMANVLNDRYREPLVAHSVELAWAPWVLVGLAALAIGLHGLRRPITNPTIPIAS